MTFPFSPRAIPGKPPHREFDSADLPYGIKLALVTSVDDIHMKANLKVITAGGDRFEIDLTQGMAGPRSFWGGVPEINSLVIIGYRRIQTKIYDAVILGYIPVGNRSGMRFDPWAADDPGNVLPEEAVSYKEQFGETIRYKRLMLRPGDVGGMSSAGAELVLSKDIRLVNRAGDGLELRDADRTLAVESRHKVESFGGIHRISGPIRRSTAYLPDDVFQADGTLKTQDEGYYGRDELEAAGPGDPGDETKWAVDGAINDIFNDTAGFPPVMHANGRRAHYVATRPAVDVDDPDGGARVFVEDRMEMEHNTDMAQDVLEEIDGFAVDRRPPYIERVIGTVAGNSMITSDGMRKYAEVLKPVLFTDFASTTRGRFSMDAIDRSLLRGPDEEVNTSAAAYLFRIRPPKGIGANEFACAVTKQGKLYLNLPKSTVDNYASSGTNNVSAEMMLDGALKAYIGASTPDRVSAHLTLQGGLHLDVGPDVDGNAITILRRGGIKYRVDAVPNANNLAEETEIRGGRAMTCGFEVKNIAGQQTTQVNGASKLLCDRSSIEAHSGYTLNAGELNQLIAGKTQLNYALAVLENIIAGGKISTILAGGNLQTCTAGPVTHTAAAGPMAFNVAAGPYAVNVGTGAVGINTGAGPVSMATGGGAVSIAAAGGAVAMTSGAAMTLTAAAVCSIAAPVTAIGGPAAVLGVTRGIPTLPAGTPSLCPVSGGPLPGAATVYSV